MELEFHKKFSMEIEFVKLEFHKFKFLKSGRSTTKKMPISDQEFMTDPKSPLKKSYL